MKHVFTFLVCLVLYTGVTSHLKAQGTNCSNAIAAATGAYSREGTASEPTWYSFTPTDAGLYQINVARQSQLAFEVEIRKSCTDMNPEKTAESRTTLINAAQGATYYIKWPTDSKITWMLDKVRNVVPGGQYTYDPSVVKTVCYQFTPTADGAYRVKGGNKNDFVYVYDDLSKVKQGISYAIKNGFGGEGMDFAATTGTTYYIVWRMSSSSTASFTWNFTKENSNVVCQTAQSVTANGATITTDHSKGTELWYQFVPATEGSYTIAMSNIKPSTSYSISNGASCANAQISISGTCYSSSPNLTFNARTTTTYFIKWDNTNAVSYTWQLVPTPTNTSCAKAKSVGTGTHSNLHPDADLWYSFTPPASGVYKISSTGGYWIKIYNECGDNQTLINLQQTGEFPVCGGKTYYFKFEKTQASYQWTLEKINVPMVTANGTSFSGTSWYEFSPGETAVYMLKATGVSYHFVNPCTDKVVYQWSDREKIFEATQGSKFYLQPLVQANLSISKVTDNSVCLTAKQAVAGTNIETTIGKYQSLWYAFTPTTNGVYRISYISGSNATDGCRIYTDCSGDENKRVTVSNLAFEAIAGVTYYVEWGGSYSGGTFTWTIKDAVPNALCQTAEAIIIDKDINIVHKDGEHYWYKIQIYSAGVYQVISTGHATYEVFNACPATSNSKVGSGTIGRRSFYAKDAGDYYIAWTTKESTTFRVAALTAEATTCETAKIIDSYENTADFNTDDVIWYLFSPKSTDKYTISNAGTYKVYSGDCSWLNNVSLSSNAFNATKGTNYYIMLQYDGGDRLRTWQITPTSANASVKNISIAYDANGQAAPNLTLTSGENGVYTGDIDNTTTEVNIQATTVNTSATVTGNGKQVLETGKTTFSFPVKVISADKSVTKDYTVTLTRRASSVATLKDLKLDGLAIVEFTPGTHSYRVSPVPYSTEKVALTGTPTWSGATTDGGERELKVNDNAITITVTAPDGVTTQTYTVNIVRSDIGKSDDVTLKSVKVNGIEATYQSSALSYNVTVPKEIFDNEQIEAIPTYENAQVSVGSKLNIMPGTNSFAITVTVENGQRQSYTLIVTREEDEDITSSGTDVYAAGVKLYPNPVDRGGQLNLELNAEFKDAVVRIYTIAGALVKTFKTTDTITSFQADMLPGGYMVHITIDNKTVTYKLMVK